MARLFDELDGIVTFLQDLDMAEPRRVVGGFVDLACSVEPKMVRGPTLMDSSQRSRIDRQASLSELDTRKKIISLERS